MGILALAADERVADVEVTEDELSVRLMDGRTISVPVVWYPRLMNATEAQRKNWQIIGGGYGIHWEDIDEDLSSEGLLRGAPAPHQSLSKANPLPQQLEVRVSDNKSRDENAAGVELFEDDDEKGVLDHLIEGEEAAAEFIAVLARIDEENRNIGAKINQRTAHLNQLISKPGGSKAGDYKRVMLLAASDMNTFSKRIEADLPSFEESIRTLEKSYSAYVSFANPESIHDIERILNLRKSLADILSASRPAQESVMDFRNSALALRSQNISKDINKAANRVGRALDGVISNIEQVASFALRVTFIINEKFGEPPIS
jgi:hypothetical protein